jgi:acetylornithine deacetylase
MYVPAQADAAGWGSGVRATVEEWLGRAATADDWLAENPPRVEWWPNCVMPMEIPESEPIVSAMLAAGADVGRPGKLSGLDSWYDGATFTLLGGTPSVAFGPGGLGHDGAVVAHTIDEHVPVDDLVRCAQALAVVALRYCKEAS